MKSRFARRSVLSLALVLGLSSLAHADVTLLNTDDLGKLREYLLSR